MSQCKFTSQILQVDSIRSSLSSDPLASGVSIPLVAINLPDMPRPTATIGQKYHMMVEKYNLNIKEGCDVDNSNAKIKIAFSQKTYDNIAFMTHFNLY